MGASGCHSSGSAIRQAAALLPESRVVAAFHNLSAVLMEDAEVESIDTDVLVLVDDREATGPARRSRTCCPARGTSLHLRASSPSRP
jgi:predicted dinucleotide-binding enzyme